MEESQANDSEEKWLTGATGNFIRYEETDDPKIVLVHTKDKETGEIRITRQWIVLDKEKDKNNAAVLQLIEDAKERISSGEAWQNWVEISDEWYSALKKDPSIVLELFIVNKKNKPEIEIYVAVIDDKFINQEPIERRKITEDDKWLSRSPFEGESKGSNYRIISRPDLVDKYKNSKKKKEQ